MTVLACDPTTSAPMASSSRATLATTPNAIDRQNPTAFRPTPTASILPSQSPSLSSLSVSAYVAAAGRGVVWVLVNHSRLYVSLDRGDTWTERTAPPEIVNGNLAFVDAQNGWALSAGAAATGCMAQGFIVWRTIDSAKSWHKVFEAPFLSETSWGCKSGIAFSDSRHGYISVSSRDAHPAVLSTSDAGVTWL